MLEPLVEPFCDESSIAIAIDVVPRVIPDDEFNRRACSTHAVCQQSGLLHWHIFIEPPIHQEAGR